LKKYTTGTPTKGVISTS